MTPGKRAGCQSQGRPYRRPTMVPFEQSPPSASPLLSSLSLLSLSSSSSVHLLLIPPLIVIVVVVIVVRSVSLAPAKRGQHPPNRRGGMTEVHPGRCSAGSSCAPLGSPPCHCLLHHCRSRCCHNRQQGAAAMECAPSFWLPWMACKKWGAVACTPAWPMHLVTSYVCATQEHPIQILRILL
jgi:hypothetical protein